MKIHSKGKVILVGAGPGDPGLITLKAFNAIRQADVIIYDNLSNRNLLSGAKEGAEIIYAGKEAGRHTMRQDEINTLMIDKANAGLMVVRLKGGDPFIFGRGGEEAEELSKAGIEFEIIPGISSAIAVPAYAGIPLTHREYASTVTFITGHEDPQKEHSMISWKALVKSGGTLVFLMGVGRLKEICQRLMEEGMSPDTPAAVIEKGTLPEQRCIAGSLKDISKKAESSHIMPPAIIVIGDVVQLRDKIRWFEDRPLFGKTIVVTRPKDQIEELATPLEELGARCIRFPLIEIRPIDRWEGLDRIIRRIDRYNWIIFTSVNGVKIFFDRLYYNGFDIRELSDAKIAAIGPATAKGLRDVGIIADLIPSEHTAEGLLKEMESLDLRGLRVLLPRAKEAREILPLELVNMGAIVDEIPLYDTVMPHINEEEFQQILTSEKIDMIIFTSSSAVKNFFYLIGDNRDLIKGIHFACIGPICAESVYSLGIKVDLIPDRYSIPSLIESIIKFFKER